jgi:hypothetical protein
MSPIFSYRFDDTNQKSPRDILVIFLASSSIEIEPIASFIEDEIEVNLVPDEILFIVRDSIFETAQGLLSNDSLSKATISRLGGRTSISVLGYDYRGAEARRATITEKKPQTELAFGEIRHRAVTEIFNLRGGFVETTSTYHFENPSGRHTQKFIRLSNILTRGAEIAFIGFCVLPHIPDDTLIAYIDTPSLYAIIAAINEQRSSFLNAPPPILADNFGSYAGLNGYRFERQDQALVLISASSSGSMASEFISMHGFESSRVVHLLFLGTNKSSAKEVCDLAWNKRKNPFGIKELPLVQKEAKCHLCASGSVAIKLQGDQFDIAGPQSPSLLIRQPDAPKGLADLMRRCAGSGIFGVGLGKSTGQQLRQFTVDVEAMLKNTTFLERLNYAMMRAIPASLSHVVPIDGFSTELAKLVASHASHESNSVAIVSRSNVDKIASDCPKAICVVAGAIESGRSLLDISRDLRSQAPDVPIIYLVGIAKTTGNERRNSLESSLIKTDKLIQHGFIQIDQIVLPQSNFGHAWSAEYNLLISPEINSLVPEKLKRFIEERIQRLARHSELMDNDLFMANSPEKTLSLNPGFVFWPSDTSKAPCSQADVFFTIASVIQQLRANSEKKGEVAAIKSNWFQQTILAPGNFGRYNDDIIQASILRTSQPYELNYTSSPADSQELGRLFRRIIDAADVERGGAAAECLLALATKRLSLCQRDLEALLNGASSTQVVVSFLLDVCRKTLLESST